LKVEPTGALSLGAVLEDSEKFADKKCVRSSAAEMLMRKFTGGLLRNYFF
jgi:hypothetical protein